MFPNAWRASVITLMPEMYPGPLGCSLVGDALKRQLWNLSVIDLRPFGIGPHQKVDDTPYGGGAGMVLKPDVVDAAIEYAMNCPSPLAGEVRRGGVPQKHSATDSPLTPETGDTPCFSLSREGRGSHPLLIHFTPRGEPLKQVHFREFIQSDVILLCGRYEAIDQRVLDKHQPREISLGDFVLTGGDIPAMALIDGCVRLLPGVIGKEASLGEESFGDGPYARLLEYPHYTKPAAWDGRDVPAVLTGGNHAEIAKWRRTQSEHITAQRRPDLLPIKIS